MSTLQTEVDILRQQLVEKEAIIKKQTREAKEKEEQSWEYNLNIIKDEYERKKEHIRPKIEQTEKQRKKLFHYFSGEFPNFSIGLCGRRSPGGRQYCSCKQCSATKQLLECDDWISRYKKSYQNEKALMHCLQRIDERLKKLEL